jgi:hypothetical protein
LEGTLQQTQFRAAPDKPLHARKMPAFSHFVKSYYD